VTGRAVGRAVLDADREQARRRFAIPPQAKVLLVMGGSLGARSINFAAVEALAERPGRDFRVIHVTGSRDFEQVQTRVEAAGHTDGYILLEYEPDLGDCLAACDLVLARSGGSVFELTARGRPAVLVPYPHATGDHQQANAEWMEGAGAATVIDDSLLDADAVLSAVEAILGEEQTLLRMSEASAGLAMPDAAVRIADRIVEAAGAAPPRTTDPPGRATP
jgi:UDP-N-acetylglucosamine--N-acetylmuramyl-(pentapeptide) pyrophosphoryl-undecaprenol N-acetylglucosamine transferase